MIETFVGHKPHVASSVEFLDEAFPLPETLFEPIVENADAPRDPYGWPIPEIKGLEEILKPENDSFPAMYGGETDAQG